MPIGLEKFNLENRRERASVRTLVMVVLLGALIGFAVNEELRQRNTSSENQSDQIMQGPNAYTNDTHQTNETDQTVGLTKVAMKLLSEAGWGHTEQVRVLLDAGADVNTREANGDTPLIAAAFQGFSETVKLLIERGADVNAKNNLGSTALMEAAVMNKSKTVEMLLAMGADTNAKNIAGLTALDAARRENHQGIVYLLKSPVAKGPTQIAPYNMANDAALQQAVIDGDLTKIRSLIASGSNANARDKNGWTALMQAAFRGNGAAVALLLASKADPNLTDSKNGRTALILATMQGHADVVRALLDGGADPNAQDKMGTTAMSAVQQSGQSHIGRLLKEAGAKTAMHNQILSQP